MIKKYKRGLSCENYSETLVKVLYQLVMVGVRIEVMIHAHPLQWACCYYFLEIVMILVNLEGYNPFHYCEMLMISEMIL